MTASEALVPIPIPNHPFGWLDLFLEVAYGDIVVGDGCCRSVGDALVNRYESTLRQVIASGKIPPSLEMALSVYCIRNVLIASPELLITSQEGGEALLEMTMRMREVSHGTVLKSVEATRDVTPIVLPFAYATSPSIVSLSQAFEQHLASLRQHLTTDEYACCMELLGDIVSCYIEQAAEEVAYDEAAQLHPGAPWVGTPSLQTVILRYGIRRYARAAAAQREARKRAREEEVGQLADELLFSPPTVKHRAELPSQTEPSTGQSDDPSRPPAVVSFASEMRAAMRTPDPEEAKMPVSRHSHTPEDTETVMDVLMVPQQHPQHRVAELDNSVLRAVAALEESLTPPLAQAAHDGTADLSPVNDSVLVVDDSGSPLPSQGETQTQGRRGGVQVAGTEISILGLLDEVDESQPVKEERGKVSIAELLAKLGYSPEVIQCVTKRTVEARTYFLCPKTGRFEPSAASGFFVN